MESRQLTRGFRFLADQDARARAAFPLEPNDSLANTADKMKTSRWIKGLGIKALALALCGTLLVTPGEAEPLRIFAAASLQGPLDAVADSWQNDATISYGGSGTVARQISQGAPADVVILANSVWMDWLLDEGHITGPAIDIVSNRLVLVGPAGSAPMAQPTAQDILKRLDGGRLAMGQHLSVPAGMYAQAWLHHIGAWDAVQPHLAETDSVRAALALVSRGEVPLGVVYASDAAATPAVAVLWQVPPGQHPAIRYPAAALTPAGAEFLTYLASQTDIFVAAGFAALP
jgi:molybdate transport system substrate-binding protein